jgi:AraC-like DNA-binding protein
MGTMPERPMDIVNVEKGQLHVGAYEHVPNGRQSWSSNTQIPRHRHGDAYAAVILSGGLQESGSRGRFDVGPGDVLIHRAFDAHQNTIFVTGAEVLHLSLPPNASLAEGLAHIADPDALAKAAETDPRMATTILLERMYPVRHVLEDWPDLLAADLIEDPNRSLQVWAREHDLAIETLSRGFSRAFGITPVKFRAEARALRAFEQIAKGTQILSKVLEVSGFADKSQMSRAIRGLIGEAPSAWLRKVSFRAKTRTD